MKLTKEILKEMVLEQTAPDRDLARDIAQATAGVLQGSSEYKELIDSGEMRLVTLVKHVSAEYADVKRKELMDKNQIQYATALLQKMLKGE